MSFHLFWPYLIQLIHSSHNITALFRKRQHIIKSGEHLSVVHPYNKPRESQLCKCTVDYRRYLGLVYYVELFIADYINVCLIKLPEPSALGALALYTFPIWNLLNGNDSPE